MYVNDVISGLSGNTQGVCLYFKGSYSSIYHVNKSNAGMNNGSFIKLEFSAG